MSPIVKILAILNLLATLAAAGVYFYTNKVYKNPTTKDETELEKFKSNFSKPKIHETYKIEKLTVNLLSQSVRPRYLDINMHFVTFEQKQIKLLENKKTQIMDIIIDISGHYEPERINSITGKILYEEEIIDKINNLFPKKIIKEIYFTKFVVQ